MTVPTIRRLRRARRAMGALALPLGLLHVVYLAAAPHLHNHDETGLLSVDLPIEYHDHDFQVAPAKGKGRHLLDVCPGCLIQAPVVPAAMSGVVAAGDLSRGPAATRVSCPGACPSDANPPRAPPLS